MVGYIGGLTPRHPSRYNTLRRPCPGNNAPDEFCAIPRCESPEYGEFHIGLGSRRRPRNDRGNRAYSRNRASWCESMDIRGCLGYPYRCGGPQRIPDGSLFECHIPNTPPRRCRARLDESPRILSPLSMSDEWAYLGGRGAACGVSLGLPAE